ncbi:MAG TPA: YajQ family cyclic di-GMP-binding protein [Candidatus Sulfotelmatobacter sp.]|nr:YajQ family cyclic di-GMP-binding protein [Candidatus Sulfotelmatobacter sp.]
MPSDSSFDVVSRVDEQELDNALNQARKEIAGRFDFKNSIASIEEANGTITLLADDALKLKNVWDIVQSKAVKRGIDLKAFEVKEPENASGGALRQKVVVRAGIPKDKSKALIEAIKAAKLKVQAQYQDEQIRVSAKSKDDLQKVIQLLKGLDYELPLQFVNYR